MVPSAELLRKVNAWMVYRKARALLRHHDSIRHPLREHFIKRYRAQIAAYEQDYPDFYEAYKDLE